MPSGGLNGTFQTVNHTGTSPLCTLGLLLQNLFGKRNSFYGLLAFVPPCGCDVPYLSLDPKLNVRSSASWAEKIHIVNPLIAPRYDHKNKTNNFNRAHHPVGDAIHQ